MFRATANCASTHLIPHCFYGALPTINSVADALEEKFKASEGTLRRSQQGSIRLLETTLDHEICPTLESTTTSASHELQTG